MTMSAGVHPVVDRRTMSSSPVRKTPSMYGYDKIRWANRVHVAVVDALTTRRRMRNGVTSRLLRRR